VSLGNGGGGLGEGVEVEEDLVPGLALVDVVDGEVEVVVSDGTLCALVHNKIQVLGHFKTVAKDIISLSRR